MLSSINRVIPDLLLRSNYRLLRHLLLQLPVLLVTVSILWDEPTQILPERFWAWSVYLVLFNLIVYVNMYWLVPRLLLKGRTRGYIVLTASLIVFLILSLGMLQGAAEGDDVATRTPMPIGILSGVAAFTLFIVGLTTFQLVKYRLENTRRIDELENATMAIELANLQQQINPHFLFNMLNNANIMADEDAEQSSRMLSKLNDLLRYQVDKGSTESVRLADDITFFRDYLELEKMRRDRFSYTIQLEGNADLEVPPLLFIPFVENAVKHNPENDSYVVLIFRVTVNKLYFECKNPKAKSVRKEKEGGIGLVNIKRRLELLFGSDYTLHLDDEKELYTAIMEVSI